jgi:hypothetical protein
MSSHPTGTMRVVTPRRLASAARMSISTPTSWSTCAGVIRGGFRKSSPE